MHRDLVFWQRRQQGEKHNSQDGFDRTQLAPLTPDDRARLVKFGTKEGSSIKALITIVTPRTFAQ